MYVCPSIIPFPNSQDPLAGKLLKDPYFFPLGHGGVDFLALKAYLDEIQWKGFLVVELDTSPWRPPKESARITAKYIQTTLKLSL